MNLQDRRQPPRFSRPRCRHCGLWLERRVRYTELAPTGLLTHCGDKACDTATRKTAQAMYEEVN